MWLLEKCSRPFNPFMALVLYSPIKNTLATVFDHSIPYSCPIASFGEDWGFVLAFNGHASKSSELINLDAHIIDELIEDRIQLVPGVPVHRYRSKGVKRAVKGDEKGAEVLKHYDGVSHRRLFALSKMLREAMKSDERIMTVENPIFMY
jgi:spermidine synthase